MEIFIRDNLSLKIITKRLSNLMEINFFETFPRKNIIKKNCVYKENCMKIVFKFFRVDILSKFFFKITLMEILKLSYWYSPIIVGF